MSARGDSPNTDYYWSIAEHFLVQDGVDQGTLMGFPCLRINGDFFSTCEHRTGALIVKLPKERVAALIDTGKGAPFAPAGRVFKEWVLVERRHRKTWLSLMEDARSFVAKSK